MREKVLALKDTPGVAAIRVDRKDGKRYIPVREFPQTAAAIAWNAAVEDADGAGGRYRFVGVSADNEILGSVRVDLATEDREMTPEDTMIAYLSGTNKQLMTLLADMVGAVTENLRGPAQAVAASPQDPLSGMLGGMISTYFMANKQAEENGSAGKLPGQIDNDTIEQLVDNLTPEQLAVAFARAQQTHGHALMAPQAPPGMSGKVGGKTDDTNG